MRQSHSACNGLAEKFPLAFARGGVHGLSRSSFGDVFLYWSLVHGLLTSFLGTGWSRPLRKQPPVGCSCFSFKVGGGASCPSYFHVCCTWSMLWPTQLSWFISFEIRIIASLACSALCVNLVLSSRPRPKTRSGCSSWSLRCWCCILVVRLTLRQRDLMRFAV